MRKVSGNMKQKTAVMLALTLVATGSLPAMNTQAAVKNPVKEITLAVEDDIQVLVIGNTYNMNYKVSPSTSKETVTFTSSNSKIATVDKMDYSQVKGHDF